MPTERGPPLFGFAPVEGRAVVAGFDGGAIRSYVANPVCGFRVLGSSRG